MAVRGKATFQKRQKEMARKDKQLRKAARRAQRKLDATGSPSETFEDIGTAPEGAADITDNHPQED